MLYLNVIDSELELIPVELFDDFAIRKFAKKKEKNVEDLLLDSNFMHRSIEKKFPGLGNRMGRPDIFHHLLNVTQDSILNIRGLLRVRIHTKNNEIIEINPATRVPRSYNRFVGIMEKLLGHGIVESNNGEVLMEKRKGQWTDLLMESMPNILLSPSGESERLDMALNHENVNLFMGGFSQGDFMSDPYKRLNPVKIFDEELTIWTVAWEVIGTVERFRDLVH